jgi:hypothetical protein
MWAAIEFHFFARGGVLIFFEAFACWLKVLSVLFFVVKNVRSKPVSLRLHGRQ